MMAAALIGRSRKCLNRRLGGTILLLIFALLSLTACEAPASPLPVPAATDAEVEMSVSAPVKLQGAIIMPGRGIEPPPPSELLISGYEEGKAGYYIVQFDGPVQEPWKGRVEAVGAELLAYLPDFAYKVRMTSEAASDVENLDVVAWVGIFQPAYKLNPNLLRDGNNLYSVRIEQGADALAATDAIRGMVDEIVGQEEKTVIIAATGEQLIAVAHVPDVAWIDNFTPNQTMNK